MRELRFRAWIPSLNRYATGFDNLYYHRQMNGEGEWWCYPEGEDEPLDVEIEQSTGLKDKNGKEIYEDDILEFDNDFDDSAQRYVPYFDEKLAAFCFRIYGYQDYISESGSEEFESEMSLIGEMENYEREEIIFYTEHISIIGNIHEQPELLEAKNVD